MRIKILGAAICLLFASLGIAKAEKEKNPYDWEIDFTSAQLATISTLKIEIIDNVGDGCLPTPNVLRNAAELELRAKGIRVTEKSSAPTITIIPLGFATGSEKVNTGCAIGLSYGLQVNAIVLIPLSHTIKEIKDARQLAISIKNTEIFHQRFLLLGPKQGMQKRVKDKVEDFTEELILEIFKAREDIFEKYPHLKANFEALKKSK